MKQSGSIVHVEYQFAWPAEQVFDAWLDPGLLARWMFDEHLADQTVIDIELHPIQGRQFRFCVEQAGEYIEYSGEYVCIERPRRLIFTWLASNVPQDTLVTVEIAALANGCRLRLTHDLGPGKDHIVDTARALWEAEFACLEKVLH